MSEIVHHAQRAQSNRDNVELAGAASKWTGPNRSLLGDPHCFTERAEVEKIRALVRSASKKAPKTKDADLGESETLLYAQETSSVALIDENAGRDVASGLGISAHSTLDVLISAYNEKDIELGQLKAMWEQIRASTFDGGDVLPSDRGGLRRWPTPAPR
ncbi:hypothetical protein ACTMS0_24160 [Micromonospora sp. H33]|uniref:hypothetical protein n=1 Tax=Micromonospora sp. H33 TaxID=3452215 RepID=UPI003F8CDD24